MRGAVRNLDNGMEISTESNAAHSVPYLCNATEITGNYAQVLSPK